MMKPHHISITKARTYWIKFSLALWNGLPDHQISPFGAFVKDEIYVLLLVTMMKGFKTSMRQMLAKVDHNTHAKV
jgi:hypothetical protein